MAIDGAEVAPSRGEIWVIQNSRFESLRTDIVPGFAAITVERPVGPDAHALCDQRTDVGVAGQEPQQFTQRRLPINALGGQQRDRIVLQRESHRLAEQRAGARSEEHTSELQSLMRTSYAVFCLK